MGVPNLESVDATVPLGGKEKSLRIDLGLALLSAIAIPGVRYTRDDISLWCGCTDTTIFNIEQRALRKLRERLRRELGLSYAELSALDLNDLLPQNR